MPRFPVYNAELALFSQHNIQTATWQPCKQGEGVLE